MWPPARVGVGQVAVGLLRLPAGALEHERGDLVGVAALRRARARELERLAVTDAPREFANRPLARPRRIGRVEGGHDAEAVGDALRLPRLWRRAQQLRVRVDDCVARAPAPPLLRRPTVVGEREGVPEHALEAREHRAVVARVIAFAPPTIRAADPELLVPRPRLPPAAPDVHRRERVPRSGLGSHERRGALDGALPATPVAALLRLDGLGLGRLEHEASDHVAPLRQHRGERVLADDRRGVCHRAPERGGLDPVAQPRVEVVLPLRQHRTAAGGVVAAGGDAAREVARRLACEQSPIAARAGERRCPEAVQL